MYPHMRSATIEVTAAVETVAGDGQLCTDRDAYDAMLRYGRQWPDRLWTIEGCAGFGKHIANRLLADGEQVVDVPPKLSVGAPVFASGHGKTDATDTSCFVHLVTSFRVSGCLADLDRCGPSTGGAAAESADGAPEGAT